ncbi:9198_t:CDS:2 [Funneliformis mosseae]|uniref:9198_t:CDS:1 n=1 Tax=Funneliformis mosseae TaxID=27381 RepID=A0A9N9CYC6_FUNMO|nr:9198_t:CDS:2 [Funneliformis mosseae]
MSDKWAGIENQESPVNIKVPFDVTKITHDNINIEDIIITSTQSSDIIEKTIVVFITKSVLKGFS